MEAREATPSHFAASRARIWGKADKYCCTSRDTSASSPSSSSHSYHSSMSCTSTSEIQDSNLLPRRSDLPLGRGAAALLPPLKDRLGRL